MERTKEELATLRLSLTVVVAALVALMSWIAGATFDCSVSGQQYALAYIGALPLAWACFWLANQIIKRHKRLIDHGRVLNDLEVGS